MNETFDNGELSQGEAQDYGQDNTRQSIPCQTQKIEVRVARIEGLYGLITQEFEQARVESRPVEEDKIEDWSREIDKMCKEVAQMPVLHVSELQAKISLNLMLMSRSMMDRHAITLYSNNILSSLDQFKDSHAVISLQKTG